LLKAEVRAENPMIAEKKLKKA